MQHRTLGPTGPSVSAVGLGLMGMSDFYGPADRTEAIRTIHAALERGVTLLDTGDFYGSGHNEMLLAEALEGRRRDQAFIAVKAGVLRDPGGGFLGVDNRPAALKNFLAMSLKRLKVDHIDLFQPARLDPAVPIEEVAGAVGEMIEQGWVRHFGLSEVGAGTLRRAHAVTPVAALQIEYSIVSRGIEAELLPAARALGIGVTAYGVLSRGLLSGRWTPARDAADFRSHLPRFSGDNLERNLALVDRLKAIAAAQGTSLPALALAWVLSRGPDIVPLIGARRSERLEESLAALALELDPATLEAIETAAPPGAIAGTRYDAAQMAMLDSERASGGPADARTNP